MKRRPAAISMDMIQDELLAEAINLNKIRHEANREVFDYQADRGAAQDRERSAAH
jgi:hypothetical protein